MRRTAPRESSRLLVAVGVALAGCGGAGSGTPGEGAGGPAPSVTVSSAPRPTPIGEEVPVGDGGSLTVFAVAPNVTARGAARPKAGRRLVAVEAQGCAGPREVGLSFTPSYFQLEWPGHDPVVPTGAVKRPALAPSVLGPGQCVRGWITFDAPREAVFSAVVYEGARTHRWAIDQG